MPDLERLVSLRDGLPDRYLPPAPRLRPAATVLCQRCGVRGVHMHGRSIIGR